LCSLPTKYKGKGRENRFSITYEVGKIIPLRKDLAPRNNIAELPTSAKPHCNSH